MLEFGLASHEYACSLRMRSPAIVLMSLLLVVSPRASLPAATCRDILLSSADLEDILDTALGSWRGLVRDRTVSIQPNSPACYLSIRMSVALLGIDCVLQACSVAVYEGRRIGLKEFDVSGCDAIWNLFPVSRRVPTALADASSRIAEHCGSSQFEITEVSPVQTKEGAWIRVALRSVP
jgi:hypothetical protein